MDGGEVIQGLDESWTFLGAKFMEWIAGLMMFLLAGDLIGWTYSMPLLLAIFVGTTVSLASLRRLYPDEERGLMNSVLIALGFAPPDIPTPAALQQYWSGAPVRALPKHSDFVRLKLSGVIDAPLPIPEQ